MITLRERWDDWLSRRKNESELAALKKVYEPAIDKLKGDDREREIAAYHAERQIPEIEIDQIDTKYLKAKARALGIEISKDEEWWDEDYYRGRYLSEVGKTRLNKLIRLEKWERNKRILDVAAVLVSALTGLLGTLIGVLSFMKSK